MPNQPIPNAKSRIDIYDRIDKFVLQTLQITKLVPRNLENIEIVKQLIRSNCSIGANANEADGTLSSKEFLHSFSIARREAKETKYWLKLLSELNSQLKPKLDILSQEADELVAILSKIIFNTQQNKN